MNTILVAKELLAVTRLLTGAHPQLTPEQIRAIADAARGYKKAVVDYIGDDGPDLGTLEFKSIPKQEETYLDPPEEGEIDIQNYDKQADKFVRWDDFDYRHGDFADMTIDEFYREALKKAGRTKIKVKTYISFDHPKTLLKGWANVTVKSMDGDGILFHLADIEIDMDSVYENADDFEPEPQEYDPEEWRERHRQD